MDPRGERCCREKGVRKLALSTLLHAMVPSSPFLIMISCRLLLRRRLSRLSVEVRLVFPTLSLALLRSWTFLPSLPPWATQHCVLCANTNANPMEIELWKARTSAKHHRGRPVPLLPYFLQLQYRRPKYSFLLTLSTRARKVSAGVPALLVVCFSPKAKPPLCASSLFAQQAEMTTNLLSFYCTDIPSKPLRLR